MLQIRQITDLRNKNDIPDTCHAVNEHVLITENGYGDMVVMSNETYEQVAEYHRIDGAIAESEAEYQAQGILLDAAETLSGLRRKHLG